MRRMAAIPQSTCDSITWRLLDHAATNWPQLKKVQVSYRGAFAYVAGVLPGGEQIPLCRLRYGGSAHSFGFAIYSAAHDGYQDARSGVRRMCTRVDPSGFCCYRPQPWPSGNVAHLDVITGGCGWPTQCRLPVMVSP